MFDDTAYSPETIEIAKVLHDLRRSGRKLSAFMGKLADLNEQHGNPKDEDLFAGEELAEPSLMNDIPIANQYAEELTRAKYSRDAENQLDNQGEKADNEIEVFTDYAELEKLAQAEKNKKEYGYYSKIKAEIDEAVERRSQPLLNRIVDCVQGEFRKYFTISDSKIDPHILMADERRIKVVKSLAEYASRFVDKPSNYKESLNTLVRSYDTIGDTREDLIRAYNRYKAVAEGMLNYGNYVYREMCEKSG